MTDMHVYLIVYYLGCSIKTQKHYYVGSEGDSDVWNINSAIPELGVAAFSTAEERIKFIKSENLLHYETIDQRLDSPPTIINIENDLQMPYSPNQ